VGRVVKLWQSKIWLTRKYHREKLTEEEIAKQAGCSQATINRQLKKFGLKFD
jgi:DNA-binding MurR/RpiR family transcriptional regulator